MTANVAAVVVAAGRGLRAGGDLPKQYRELLGEPVIRPSLAALAGHSGISLVQPPQAFDFAALLTAHRRAKAMSRDDFTDDAALAEWAGLKVTTFAGEAENVKLTTDDDFVRAEAAKLAALSDVRTGFGFDVHRFGEGDHVMLGGVRISHRHGLSGHSDAGVGLHALVGAILGAVAAGDIAVHFPPLGPRLRGCSSDRVSARAAAHLRVPGGAISPL